MRLRPGTISRGLILVAFSLNACGIVAALHEAGQRGQSFKPVNPTTDCIQIHGSSHRADECGLCHLLALTTGKIHLTEDAPDEGVERYVFCLTLPDHPIHRVMMCHCPTRGPPTA